MHMYRRLYRRRDMIIITINFGRHIIISLLLLFIIYAMLAATVVGFITSITTVR